MRGHLRKTPFGSPIAGTSSQAGGGNKRKSAVLAVSAIILAGSSIGAPLSAQNGAQQDTIGEDMVDAVTQPLSDLNLRSREIPLILILAQDAPYDLTEIRGCAAIRGELARLEDVLGPDADQPREGTGLINRGLRTGGKMISGFIPFRGIVRRISGARAQERQWEEAVYAGVARRSYLKGYMAGQQCGEAEEQAPPTARDILGLGGALDADQPHYGAQASGEHTVGNPNENTADSDLAPMPE